ncbi:hypothetical protein ANTHELSMS3_02309 [Antarctobacter heliothermus]|uniref:Uncharacterized protein n=1 Tax=Antarctobacter heliothermus TaxID=74033 RepID=A0A222E461_9RHOB|nr:hypothetical protein ANTHELSMS3_02309 [Antarctobacter heliothermus]
MVKRFILTMLVVLAGLSVTISPVVAQAAFGQTGCGITEVGAHQAHTQAGHMMHANYGKSAHISTFIDQNTCCDKVCSVDFLFQIGERPTAFRETSLPRDWDSTSPRKQSGPFGLKRPPRV